MQHYIYLLNMDTMIKKMNFKMLIKLFVAVILFLFIFNHFQISAQSLYKHRILFPFWIFLSIFIRVVINPILSCSRWKIFLSYAGVSEQLFPLIKISFISLFYGIIMPSSVGVDVIKIFIIEKKHPSIIGTTGSTVIAEMLLGFFLLSIMGTIGTIYLQFKILPSNLYMLMIAISIMLFLLILILSKQVVFDFVKKILYKIGQITKFAIFLKIISYIEKLYGALFRLPLKKCFIKALPFMVCFQLSNILIGCFLFYSFGVELPFYIHLALLPIIQIISIIPISISGFGLREGAFAYFYSLVGVAPEISVVVSILYLLVGPGSGAIVGGIIVLLSNISRKYFIKKNQVIDD